MMVSKMTIWLAGKSLDDLVQIPLSLDERRLDVRPSERNNVYVVDGHFFHYQLMPEEPPQITKYGFDIGRQFARVGDAVHGFRDGSGTKQELRYWNIELWNRIPEEFRDVFFYHEVIEATHMAEGLPQPKAHELARAADLTYRKKHLGVEEQERFIRAEQQLLSQK